MPRKPTISFDAQGSCGEFLVRPCVGTDHLLAAYAEMAADSEREAEAEEWLAGVFLGHAAGPSMTVGSPVSRVCSLGTFRGLTAVSFDDTVGAG